MNESFGECVAHYKKLGLAGTPLGLNEIADLEQSLGVTLPLAYRAFLSIAGELPPPALIGSDCHSDNLPKLRKWAISLLSESGCSFELPADAVVFLMHQGYQFFYFRTFDRTNDPAVFHYFENWPSPVQRYGRFSEWVKDCAVALNA